MKKNLQFFFIKYKNEWKEHNLDLLKVSKIIISLEFSKVSKMIIKLDFLKFCPRIKMETLSLKELILIAKNRNVSDCKSMSKDKLLGIINNNTNNKRDQESIFKSKKGLYKPGRNSLFKLKREKIKKSLFKPVRKNLFKSKIEEIKEILHDPIINRNEKIEEIKKVSYDLRNNLFKPEKDHYKPVRIGNAFSSNYIQYEKNGDKYKSLKYLKPI